MKITRRQLKRIIREVIEGPDAIWYDDYGNPLQPDQLEDEGLTDGGVIEILFDRDFNTYKAPNGEQARVNLNSSTSAEDEIAAIQDLAASSGATHVNDDGTILTIDDMITAIQNDEGI